MRDLKAVQEASLSVDLVKAGEEDKRSEERWRSVSCVLQKNPLPLMGVPLNSQPVLVHKFISPEEGCET